MQIVSCIAGCGMDESGIMNVGGVMDVDAAVRVDGIPAEEHVMERGGVGLYVVQWMYVLHCMKVV